ncbi:KpsF/GutQ family sugar-phosphate isomerase [Capnocytophaga sputigena]|jgi:sugar isomerase, kpsF/gutQ family|uniref:Arabinose 5-phosphate isomerase KpsF n=1 Tax=Capnocytophaga sputigena TaxID=1019 RepID=A0A2A3N2Y7_CAPSP|nr:KpsF/GutQ family sugar-phosphate isomerase [Capnocytophaga sputigena]ATA69441.1 KpsF/GutQ family sugar-phosphate isomerase [Capnocytophaga sputigena]ATA78217.1 KpsF/GutQ family sugar-phosphate isomerase [Capnocytophaga sputigena]ATA83052.1 KpsF/GutQ family sugar-phosphate isomerase [Capnocytophaga sputigena]EEB66476.1 sugar isomerase, KpsF/GutQ family [Capnocytophaga sputigena ATCC 33612]PBN46115.1 KpsF/GutQ family sugar-phosphate isomerase [Capnocytophaga sputigena]
MNSEEIITSAKQTITEEAQAIAKLIDYIDDDFTKSVQYILQSKGRVVITGIGKSAIIANKIVATMNSTGTPAIFMHAADAIHGDLGIIQQDDVVICISKSGNTPEIKVLVPLLKRGNNKLIAITSNKNSVLAQQADSVLYAHVDKEACPNNLAPTTSTTAQLVLGDALAVCLLEMKHFGSSDFAKYHPGGALGKRLYLKVSDIVSHNQKPEVSPDTDIKKVIVEISEKMLGVTAVLNNHQIVGIVTDGDIRRMLSKTDSIKGLTAKDIMSVNPKTIEVDCLAIDALHLMEKNKITQLLATKQGEYVGIIHLHNLIQEGLI